MCYIQKLDVTLYHAVTIQHVLSEATGDMPNKQVTVRFCRKPRRVSEPYTSRNDRTLQGLYWILFLYVYEKTSSNSQTILL